MVNMIKKRRKENKSVTQKMIQNEARRKFPELYPDEEPFLASEGWIRRFFRRNKVVFRRATSVEQKIPENAPELADAFLDSKQILPEYHTMDETPCYFDVPRAGTFDF